MESNSICCEMRSPPWMRSPLGAVGGSPALGVLPPPSSSSHAANARTAITAIAASSHNHRNLWGSFIVCLLFLYLPSRKQYPPIAIKMKETPEYHPHT